MEGELLKDKATGEAPEAALKEVLLERIRHNPRYSLRAFARDLNLSHSFLSQILNKRRRLSPAQAFEVAHSLGFTEDRTKHFILGSGTTKVYRSTQRSVDSTLTLEIDQFRLVSEWYHGAIAELTDLDSFKPTYSWIAKRLGITVGEAREALNRLVRLGVLRKQGNSWIKTKKLIYFPTSRTSLAVRSYHEQNLQKAIGVLQSTDQQDFEARDITGITVAINRKNLPEAKRRITAFQQNLATLLGTGTKDDVYQMNVQLFSLTKKSEKKSKRGSND